LPPHELEALERYISTLPGPPVHASSAAPDEGGVSQLARGSDVFFSAGCGSCHAAEKGFADGQRHDVRSRLEADAVAAFDTPSLRFVAGTAPYFHDGRYPTLRALLESNSPMGAARDRPAEELDALEAFVRSL
jgi:cytochrome c peroxidase